MCSFSSPFPLPDALHFQQQPGVWWQAGSCSDTDYANSLQDFRSCDLCTRRLRKELLPVILASTTTTRVIVSASGFSVQHTQNEVSTDSARCRGLSAYSQQCKLLTKRVLLAGDILCILHYSASTQHHVIGKDKLKNAIFSLHRISYVLN